MQSLFKIKGFFPYLLMLFLNAFVDLGHKIVIQNTIFKIYDGQQQIVLTAIINALILLPYIFLFSPCGYISDKYPKDKVMRYSAFVEVLTVSCVIASYYFGLFWLAFSLTLFMAIQSAVYSPAKYGYIRELVGDTHLAAANGLVQAATIIAILGGTLVFSALFESHLNGLVLHTTHDILQHIHSLGFVILFLAAAEFALAFLLPTKSTRHNQMRFSFNEYLSGRYLKKNVNAITRQPVIWLSIIGLLVFWAASQVVLASFPAFAKEAIQETNTLVIQGILASTGIGIVVGSLLAGHLSKRSIEASFIPLGVVGFSCLIGVIPLLHSAWLMAMVFICIGFFGGIYIVPLNAMMQYHARSEDMGTILAGNNWMQNIVMLLALLATIFLAKAGINSAGLFYFIMVGCLLFSVYLLIKMPYTFARFIDIFTHWRFRVLILGFEHLPKQQGILLVGEHFTHQQFAILQLAYPNKIHGYLPKSKKLLNQCLGFIQHIHAMEYQHIHDDFQAITVLLSQGKTVALPDTVFHQYNDWRKSHGNLLANTVFVPFLIAATEDDICAVVFGEGLAFNKNASVALAFASLPFMIAKYETEKAGA